MLRLHRLLLAGLLVVAGSRLGWAAGLLEVYRDAVVHDPQLAEAAANRRASLETKPQARALLLPNVGTSFGYDKEFNVDSDPGTGQSSGDSRNISIDLNQPIYRRDNLVRNRQADAVLDQAETDYRSAEQDLILRVAETYFAVLADLDDLVFTRADKEATARQLEQAKRRFEVGLITITDVHEAQARFDLVQADEITAVNDLADSVEALREITGIYYGELDGVSVPPGQRVPRPEPTDPDIWIQRGLANNPRLLSALFAVEVARENVELQKSGHYPTLDLVARYNDSDTDTFDTSGNSVGLRLNIPLYQGGAVVSRTREAAHLYEAARQRLENQQRMIVRQVRDAYRGLEAARTRIQALDQARVSNESALEATEAGFEVGTRTIVDVLDAQRDLFLARRDFSVSRYDYILNFLRLKQAAGEITEDDLARWEPWLQEDRALLSETEIPTYEEIETR